MTIHDVWYTIKTTFKKAVAWVSVASIITTAGVHAVFHDVLKNAPMLDAVKDYVQLLTLVGIFIILFTVTVILQLLGNWANKRAPVHIDNRPTVKYHAYSYRVGDDLDHLSKFAHDVFKGDTMTAEIVKYAVDKKAAVGLRLTNPDGENIGFLDAFHLTDSAMKQWMNGDISEKELDEEHFRKIPARGKELNLAFGAIYVKRRSERGRAVDEGVAHIFANTGELFLRKSFPAFKRINLYATIFRKSSLIADEYKFAMEQPAAKRTGDHANGHDLRLKVIDRALMPHQIGGADRKKRIIIELAG